MTPGTLVLLHSPLTTHRAWGKLPEALRSYGLRVVVPEVGDDNRPPYASRYVVRATLEIGATQPEAPLVLVGHSGAGPLLPPIAAAQRAAHRLIGGYIFCDAWLPAGGEASWLDLVRAVLPEQVDEFTAFLDSGGRFPSYELPAGLVNELRPRGKDFFTEPLPMAQDWPDAPCGYLLTSTDQRRMAKQARLRGWPVAEHDRGHFAAYEDPKGTADALTRLLAAL